MKRGAFRWKTLLTDRKKREYECLVPDRIIPINVFIERHKNKIFICLPYYFLYGVEKCSFFIFFSVRIYMTFCREHFLSQCISFLFDLSILKLYLLFLRIFTQLYWKSIQKNVFLKALQFHRNPATIKLKIFILICSIVQNENKRSLFERKNLRKYIKTSISFHFSILCFLYAIAQFLFWKNYEFFPYL